MFVSKDKSRTEFFCGGLLSWKFVRNIVKIIIHKIHVDLVFIPHHKKVAGYYVTPSESFEFPSVRLSALRFRSLNLSSFWPIFFKLCMDINIGEEWFGIANGLNLFINNRVMALDWCKNVFFLNTFGTNGWILIKFCICIDTNIQDPCCF